MLGQVLYLGMPLSPTIGQLKECQSEVPQNARYPPRKGVFWEPHSQVQCPMTISEATDEVQAQCAVAAVYYTEGGMTDERRKADMSQPIAYDTPPSPADHIHTLCVGLVCLARYFTLACL